MYESIVFVVSKCVDILNIYICLNYNKYINIYNTIYNNIKKM